MMSKHEAKRVLREHTSLMGNEVQEGTELAKTLLGVNKLHMFIKNRLEALQARGCKVLQIKLSWTAWQMYWKEVNELTGLNPLEGVTGNAIGGVTISRTAENQGKVTVRFELIEQYELGYNHEGEE